jgi:uncharacterized protein
MAYTIWTTGACNLKCKYCYEGLDKPSLQMTSNIAKEALNYIIKDFDTKTDEELLINFHGGEPFLNFDIIQYFVSKLKQYYADKKQLVFTVTTNATILSKQIIDFIITENIETTVSIDGEKSTHDKMRPFINGQGSHDIVMNNALILLEKMPNLRIRMTFNSETVGQLSQNVKYLLNKGFLTIVPGIDSFDKRWDENHIEILKKEIMLMKEYLKDYPNAAIGLCEKLICCGKKCNGGVSSKHIYYNGSIYPCMITGGYKEFAIGNVFEGINIEKRDRLLEHSLYDNAVCLGCDLDAFCVGARCKIINKLKTGDYYTPAAIECHLTNLMYSINGVSDTDIH